MFRYRMSVIRSSSSTPDVDIYENFFALTDALNYYMANFLVTSVEIKVL